MTYIRWHHASKLSMELRGVSSRCLLSTIEFVLGGWSGKLVFGVSLLPAFPSGGFPCHIRIPCWGRSATTLSYLLRSLTIHLRRAGSHNQVSTPTFPPAPDICTERKMEEERKEMEGTVF